jgi:hypothetical protein
VRSTLVSLAREKDSLMMKLRLLLTLALGTTLLLPVSAVFAQDESAEASATPEATSSIDDANLEELRDQVPLALADLPLHENLILVTGEEYAQVMPEAEAALVDEMLEANGKTADDYAGALTYLDVTETDVVVIQAHRVAGVEASEIMDEWIAILTLSLEEPVVNEGFVAGRATTFIRDEATPEVPALQLIPAGEVMWMIVAVDQALAEEFIESLGLVPEDAA